jgi:hypothetical protein
VWSRRVHRVVYKPRLQCAPSLDELVCDFASTETDALAQRMRSAPFSINAATPRQALELRAAIDGDSRTCDPTGPVGR